MKALQMHYTSCRQGLSGQAGFQTRALSEGVRPEERRELERRGAYRPPRDAPPAPSPEELARDFPVAFRGGVLESGRTAVTRSCYTGKDYSGRWGNFFSHSLVLDDDEAPPPALWPIDLYEWPGWAEGLASGNDPGAPPASLAPVDLAEVAPAESFHLSELADFLNEEPERPGLLARMARALLLGRDSSRPVVIRASGLDGLYWIAAVQKLFPCTQAWRTSFSTYQEGPRGCAQLNATTGATDFRLDEPDRKYRFYVFDLIESSSSDVPEAEDDYPAVAARWLAESPRRFAELRRFTERFDCETPATASTAVVDLFRLVDDDEFRCSAQRFAEAVKVASERAPAGDRAELLDRLSEAACERGSGDPVSLGLLVRFLTQRAKETGEAGARRRAFDVWWSLVQSAHSPANSEAGQICAPWASLEEAFSGSPREIRELLVDALSRSLADREPPGPVALRLLQILLSCLRRSGEETPWNHPVSRTLLGIVAQAEGFEAALLPVRSEPAALVDVAYALLDRGLDGLGGWNTEDGLRFQETVGRALGAVLSKSSTETVRTVRRRLAADERWRVLFGEWLALLERAPDRRRLHDTYRREVLEALPGYLEAQESAIASSLLAILDEGDARSQGSAWLADGSIERFQPDLARRCLTLANGTLPLLATAAEGTDGERADRFAELLSSASERMSFELSPDRPLLYRTAKTLQARHEPPGRDGLLRFGDAVERLSSTEAEGFLEVVLPLALEHASNLDDHRRVLASLVPRRDTGCAVPGYRRFFRTRESRWPPALQATLRFWLHFEPSDAETGHLSPLERLARAELARALSKLSGSLRSQVEERVRQDAATEPAASRWQAIAEAAERRDRRRFDSLLGVAAKLIRRVGRSGD